MGLERTRRGRTGGCEREDKFSDVSTRRPDSVEEAIGWLGEDVTVLEEHQADSRPTSASIRPAIAASARDKQADEAMRQRRAHLKGRGGG